MKQIESSAKRTVLLEETKLFVFLSDKFTGHQFQLRSALSTRVMHLIIAIYIGNTIGILVIKLHNYKPRSNEDAIPRPFKKTGDDLRRR